MTEISRFFEFSAGHTLALHQGKCRLLHGHNYRFLVSVEAPLDAQGMVMDFGDLKEVVARVLDDVDHRFIIWEEDPRALALMAVDTASVIMVPFHPTAENLVGWLKKMISAGLHNTYLLREPRRAAPSLAEVTLWETENCGAHA